MDRMKLFYRQLPFVFLMLLLPSFVLAAQQQVRVGIFPFAPINFLDQNNQASGFNPALLNKMAEEHDWQLTFVEGNWAEGLARLQRGKSI